MFYHLNLYGISHIKINLIALMKGAADKLKLSNKKRYFENRRSQKEAAVLVYEDIRRKEKSKVTKIH